MKTKLLHHSIATAIAILCFFGVTNVTYGQTPGLIYKPAVNGGNRVLDPNGDGYTSLTTAGFTGTNDEGAAHSEIPYKPFPALLNEPLSDLQTGASGGHTDFATRTGANSSPLAAHFDGTNMLFRIRLGGQSSASKGYSVLIDSDGVFAGTGLNPGFEFEVLLATNFDVRVIRHTGTTQSTIFSGSVTQYSQKSIAATREGGDADYFYDFYVPISAFQGAITPTTPLRMSGITITSAQSGLTGTVSDVGGVDDRAYGNDKYAIWRDVIATFPSTTLTGVQTGFAPIKAIAPVVYGPVRTGQTSINGSSAENEGTVVTIYQNGISIGTTTVTLNNTWQLSNLSPSLLVSGASITAKVSPLNKAESDLSIAVIVSSGTCNYSTPIGAVTTVSNRKGLSGTSMPNATVRIYRNGILYQTVTASSTGGWILQECTTGNHCIGDGAFTVTQQIGTGCESVPTAPLVSYQGGNTRQEALPTFTVPINLCATSTTLSGTSTANAFVIVYINGNPLYLAGTSERYTVQAAASGAWSVTRAFGFVVGDQVSIRAYNNSSNNSTSMSEAVSKTVSSCNQSAIPAISGSYCGTVTKLEGTSTEVSGTQIRIYTGSSTPYIQVGTAIVNAKGTWSATGLNIPSGTPIRATATAVSKFDLESSYSAPVTSSTQTTTTATINGAVFENAISVSGTISAAGPITVRLYITGQAMYTATVPSGSNTWQITGISPFELYAGATIYVTTQTGTQCESVAFATQTVQCNPKNTAIVPALSAAFYCPNTPAIVRMPSSEVGVIYNLYVNGQPSGTSVLGTGNAISLTSAPLTQQTTLEVIAITVGANCNVRVGSTLTAMLYPPVPNNFDLTASAAVTGGGTVSGANLSLSCPNVPVTITVVGAQRGYSYQLIINNTAKTPIGTPVVPTADGNFSFPPVNVAATTTYSVIIRNIETQCVSENVNNKTTTITVTGGADLSRAVTFSPSTVCVNGTVTISVATQSGFNYTVKGSSGTVVGSMITGNGEVQSVTTPGLTTTGTHIFYVEVSGGTCPTTRLTTEVSVVVTSGTAEPVSAGPAARTCGSTYTLAGSNPAPGAGKWTVTGRPANAPNPVFNNDTNSNAVVSNLVSGTYTFTWTVTSSCSGNAVSASSVTITVNCAAVYAVTGAKYIAEYQIGEPVAVASDSDGGVTAARYSSGAFPPGLRIDPVTGIITVANKDNLQAGVYSFVVEITDNSNGNFKSTMVPVVITMYSPNSIPSPFPVEIVYFTATKESKGVKLQWVTASEKENDRFEVERSVDGKSFEKIGTVKGAGNSAVKQKYSLTDATPVAGTMYYRLKQVDFDGTFEYSKVVAVNSQGVATAMKLQAYPNPFSDKLTVAVTSEQVGATQLTLLDMQGRVVATKSQTVTQGVNEFEFTLRNLANGVYILKITGTGIDATTKVIRTN